MSKDPIRSLAAGKSILKREDFSTDLAYKLALTLRAKRALKANAKKRAEERRLLGKRKNKEYELRVRTDKFKKAKEEMINRLHEKNLERKEKVKAKANGETQE